VRVSKDGRSSKAKTENAVVMTGARRQGIRRKKKEEKSVKESKALERAWWRAVA